MSNLKLNYFKHSVDARFVSKKLFFWFWKPVQMAKYDELKTEFRAKSWGIDFGIGMIEQATMIGFGKIGLTHESGDWIVKDEFVAYKLVGDYAKMKDIYQQIMKDFPSASGFYNLYLTDPNVTQIAENITYILFKQSEISDEDFFTIFQPIIV